MQENNSVFEHKLNEEGIARLRQMLTICRVLIVIGAFQIPLFIAESILRVVTTRLVNSGDTMYEWLMLYVSPIYGTVYVVLYIAYTVFFFVFARKANRSIVTHDNEMFNRSYKYLVTGLWMDVILQVTTFIVTLVFFFNELNYYKILRQSL